MLTGPGTTLPILDPATAEEVTATVAGATRVAVMAIVEGVAKGDTALTGRQATIDSNVVQCFLDDKR